MTDVGATDASAVGRAAALTVVTILALGACTASREPEATSQADLLWSSRTAFVGDNSRVAALVRAAGFTDLGEATISVQTAAEPYGVTIDLDPGASVDEGDLTTPAVLVLGLVGNLGEVSVTAGDQVYSFTDDAVSDVLGYDVKTLGEDRDRLDAYLQEPAAD